MRHLTQRLRINSMVADLFLEINNQLYVRSGQFNLTKMASLIAYVQPHFYNCELFEVKRLNLVKLAYLIISDAEELMTRLV